MYAIIINILNLFSLPIIMNRNYAKPSNSFVYDLASNAKYTHKVYIIELSHNSPISIFVKTKPNNCQNEQIMKQNTRTHKYAMYAHRFMQRNKILILKWEKAQKNLALI